MEYLTDVKISSVYDGASGTGEHGPYQILNLYFEGHDKKKFSWFQKGDRKPAPGDVLKIIGYEMSNKEKDGTVYTNRNIKQMQFAAQAAQKATSKPSNGNSTNITMYVSYVKDIVVAKISKGEELTLAKAVDLIATESRRLYDLVEGGATKETEAPQYNEPPPGYEPPPMDEDSDLPF